MKKDNLCQHCSSPLQGRSDKKFCDVYCRNSFNNEKLRERTNIMRNIEHALRRNRKILEGMCVANKQLTHSEMLNKGFDFKYMTHQSDNLYCVYDFAYMIGKGNMINAQCLSSD